MGDLREPWERDCVLIQTAHKLLVKYLRVAKMLALNKKESKDCLVVMCLVSYQGVHFIPAGLHVSVALEP